MSDIETTYEEMARKNIIPGCGHPITVVSIDIGERREGGDWRVLGKEFEASCELCGTKRRFEMSAL